MKIGLLTSSRADYSIYLPLLRKLKEDAFFELSIIAFGSHLSPFHGYTVDQIEADGFVVAHKVESMLLGDNPESISSSIGVTTLKFAALWQANKFDLVIALGDRYEMFAAVLSATPFNIKIAHLHGGETTTGAFDNAFRHSISFMSSLHFTSTNMYKKRLISILGNGQNVYNVGALSVENMQSLTLLSIKQFNERFNLNLKKRTILCTFHPETISYHSNVSHIKELLEALSEVKNYQILFTLPNADTIGNYIKTEIINFAKKRENVSTFESLGTIGYLTAMKYCDFVIGNSSSGFVDASIFPKKVINLGNRQNGRILTPNIYNCEIEKNAILNTIKKVIKDKINSPITLYGDGTTSSKIISYIKNYKLQS